MTTVTASFVHWVPFHHPMKLSNARDVLVVILQTAVVLFATFAQSDHTLMEADVKFASLEHIPT